MLFGEKMEVKLTHLKVKFKVSAVILVNFDLLGLFFSFLIVSKVIFDEDNFGIQYFG